MKSTTSASRQGPSTTTLSHLSAATTPSSRSPTSADAIQQPSTPISPKINTLDKDLSLSQSKSTPGHRACTMLKPGQLIRFKAYSVAFIVTLDSRADGPRLAKGFELSKLHVWSESSSAETTQERAVQLRMQQQSVAHRRDLIQSDRVLRLQRANQNKRYKALIHQHRDRLETLKLQAKLEYAMTAASVRRHLIQRRRIELLNSRIEHAQNVALLQKFKKLSILKQALIGDLSREELALLSDTSLELLDLSRELDPEQFESDTEDLVTSPSIPSITIATDGTSLKQGSHSFAPTRRELPSSTHPRHEPFQYKSLADRILEEKAIDPNIFLEMDELTYLDLLPLLAPVTRFSLRELDIDEIILSAQIRHDLYFDPNLQFKANLDGPNGKEKLEQRNEYWEVVGQELAQGHYFRIPLLLHEVTAILKELLPRSKSTDQEIADWIDPVLIAQQIEFQAFNPCSLVSSLAELLKRHCAPARDATVDQMVVECNAGKFTETLCIMFEVLETMKLDYANYQISRVRPFLVEKQLEFEWRWFKDQLDAELQSLENTTQWLCTLGPKSDLGDSTQARFVRAFMALVQAIPTYSSAELPETLGLDQDRLQAMHSDWQDILVTSSLLLHFKQLTGNRVSLAQLVELKETLYVLLNDPETSLDHLVLELAHRVSQIKGTPMTKADQETWMLLIEKVLGSNEPVYQLLSSRLLSHLSGFVQGSGPLDEALLAKHGLGPLFKDISSLGDKMKTLTELNWKIFHPLYNAIFETTEEKSS